MLKRNSLLKALALFFLGASAVLLFSSADLILNPYVSNSFVYLQKMFLSPSGTSNTVATISFDGTSGSIIASGITTNALNATNINTSVFTAAVASVTNRVNTTLVCDGAKCISVWDEAEKSSCTEEIICKMCDIITALSGANITWVDANFCEDINCDISLCPFL